MAILPRYQRIGLKTRQPQQMDFAAAREQAKLGQNISQQIDRMSDFAFKQGAQAAEVRGQERVREEGALPTLGALQEAGGPTTIAERAAFDAANRIAVVEIESLAKQDMQNLVREADKNNMPLTTFQASMANIQDGYAASLNVVDPVAAGVLSARLQDSSMTYQGRYSDITFTKAKAAAAERVAQIVTVSQQAILDSATQPGATRESIESAGSKLLADQLELGVKEKNARRVVDQTLKEAVRQNRLYLYDNAADITAKRVLLEEYEKNPLPGYTYEQNRSFNNQLQNNLNVQINRAQQTAVSDLTEAAEAMALTGTPPSGFEFNEDSIREIFPQEQADEYIQSWNDASEDASNRGALAYMSGDMIDSVAIDLERERVAAEVSGDPRQITKATTRAADWAESVAKRNDAIVKDAALFVANTNEAAAGIIEDIGDKLSTGQIEQAASGLLALRDVMGEQLDQLGVPSNRRNVMPKQMAAQVANIIQSIESDVAAETFQAINQSLGDYSPQFIEELRAQGLRPEYVQAMYVSNPAIQKDLIDISKMEVTDILKGLPNTTKNDVISEMNDVLSDYRQAYLAGGGNVANNIYNQQIDTAQKLVFSRLKNGTESEISTAVENALNDLIPEYQQTVVGSGGVGGYVVPMEFSPKEIEDATSSLLSVNALRAMGIEPLDSPLLDDYIDLEVSLESLSTTGRWLNNSTGDGLSLHYNVNGTDLPAGFEVKFSEISQVLASVQEKVLLTIEQVEPDIIEKSVTAISKAATSLSSSDESRISTRNVLNRGYDVPAAKGLRDLLAENAVLAESAVLESAVPEGAVPEIAVPEFVPQKINDANQMAELKFAERLSLFDKIKTIRDGLEPGTQERSKYSLALRYAFDGSIPLDQLKEMAGVSK